LRAVEYRTGVLKRMPTQRSLRGLLLAGAIASQGLACGGSVRAQPDDLGGAGRASGNGGTDPERPGLTAGSGGMPGSSGSGAQNGSAGNVATTGGTAGVVGIAGGGEVAGGAGSGGGVGGTGGAGDGSGGAVLETNKTILFDGTRSTFSNSWGSLHDKSVNPWQYNDDGTMTPTIPISDIASKQKFRSVFVHLEYAVLLSSPPGSRQYSGVGLNSSYGLHISDSYGLPPSIWSCGAVSGLLPPPEVACRERDAWNTYEIEFQAPICGVSGVVTTPARFLEVKLNGTLIHRDVDVLQPTLGLQAESCESRPLLLQASSEAPPTFRNIWAIARD
jgi:hypothetical protein